MKTMGFTPVHTGFYVWPYCMIVITVTPTSKASIVFFRLYSEIVLSYPTRGIEVGPRLFFCVCVCVSVQVQSTEEMTAARNGIYTSVRDFLIHGEFLLSTLKEFTQCTS